MAINWPKLLTFSSSSCCFGLGASERALMAAVTDISFVEFEFFVEENQSVGFNK